MRDAYDLPLDEFASRLEYLLDEEEAAADAMGGGDPLAEAERQLRRLATGK